MSQLYPKGAGHILADYVSGKTLKCLFYSGTFGSTNEFVADLTGADIIARSGALSGITTANGVLDANDITVAAVSGSAFGHVIVYEDTGADATSELIAIFDVSTYTPDGNSITVVWNPSGLFSIA